MVPCTGSVAFKSVQRQKHSIGKKEGRNEGELGQDIPFEGNPPSDPFPPTKHI